MRAGAPSQMTHDIPLPIHVSRFVTRFEHRAVPADRAQELKLKHGITRPLIFICVLLLILMHTRTEQSVLKQVRKQAQHFVQRAWR